MKQIWIIGIPLTFVAGITSAVMLQSFGVISINPNNDIAENTSVEPTESSINTQVSAIQLDDSSTSTAAIELAALREQVNQLQEDVRSATRQRDVIRAELTQLQEQGSQGIEGESFLPSGQTDNVTQLSEAVPTRRAGREGGQGRARGFGGPSSEQQYQALIGAGIDKQVATAIKQRVDQWELSRLDLIDQATREGWRRSDEFGDAMRDLRDQRVDIRAELGDDAYDRYLFSSGEDNRVRIASIIDGSAAQLAGMESGDLVLSYANTRIFTGQELQRATREGSRGEYVSVYVQRFSEYLELSIPRGPLGVQLTGARHEP